MTVVAALWPATKGQLLWLKGQQWVGWGMRDAPGRGATAREQGATAAAQRLAEVRYRYLGRRRYGQNHRQRLHLTGEVSGRKVVTKSARRGTTQLAQVWSGRMYHGGIK